MWAAMLWLGGFLYGFGSGELGGVQGKEYGREVREGGRAGAEGRSGEKGNGGGNVLDEILCVY